MNFENVGIGDINGEIDFYSLPESYDKPNWLQQLGTFDKKSIEFNLAEMPQLIEKITTQKVKVVTLGEIMEKYKIQSLDVLVVDAEGYEYNILKALPHLAVKPQIIQFEWGSMNETSYRDLIELLKALNYTLFKNGGDMTAIDLNQ